MKNRKPFRGIFSDNRGSALIEFAILAPALIGMMMGILYVGVQMMSYNSIRAVSSDIARYTLVEYQKLGVVAAKQLITPTVIKDRAIAIAVNPPYSLNADNLNVAVTKPNSDITGTDKFTATITYTPYNPVGFMGVDGPVMVETRSFYVGA